MRLAWFSPMPPVRSGIADCSAELVAALRAEHHIDVFVDEADLARAGSAAHETRLPGTSVRSAHDFIWLRRIAPYDLTIFQLGNSSHSDYIWPYLFRFPGLVVLHDAHLHHARAALLLAHRRGADYRAEFAANEPGVDADAAELVVAGFDSQVLYSWPFTRLAIAASRAAAVHSRVWRDRLSEAQPEAAITHIRLGHGTPLSPAELAARRARARARWGLPEHAVVFGCYGGLTPDKRLPQILDAFAATRRQVPEAWLLLAGAPAPHYDVATDVQQRTLTARTVLTGYLDRDDELTDAVAAADVTLNLRWPTAREVSGPWLRCLAASRPTIVIDLAHAADVPTLDPRTWTSDGRAPGTPVAVGVDVLDEDHSLRLAMRRLARDTALRRTLGRAAQEYWRREHAPAAMLEDYRAAIALAAGSPPLAAALPPHLVADHSGLVERLLGGIGVAVPWSKI
jgi:glycosyltransferase involved in cell wall biosynthesis